ncbi:hypothetical protein ABZU78_10725 [Rhodococcus erythropolis]|uniref:hypothetical protein n=1 Tax=Rhodococcus erythropolis TaxID=1833 RepID=UPI0033BC699D
MVNPVANHNPGNISQTQHADRRRTNAKYSGQYDDLRTRYTGTPIEVSFRELVGPLPADELTHGIFPYPARLLRQIPRMLLGAHGLVDGIDYTIDPFCGSGTIPLESQTRHILPIGFEQNPIGALISRVKTTPIDEASCAMTLGHVLATAKRSRKFGNYPAYLEKWYDDDSYSILSRLASEIASLPDNSTKDLLNVSFAVFCRRISIADRNIPVPVRDPARKGKILKNATVWTIFEDVTNRIISKAAKVRTDLPASTIFNLDSREPETWKALPRKKSGLLITSPPYGAAQKYIRSTSLEAGWLGYASDRGTINLEKSSIGREHLTSTENQDRIDQIPSRALRNTLAKITKHNQQRGNIYTTYFLDMIDVFQSANKSGAHIPRIAMIAGTNTAGQIYVDTREFLASIVEETGYQRILSLRDPIRGRALLTRRRGTAVPALAEYIEIFETKARIAG